MNPDSSSAVASTDLARPGPRPRPVVAAVRLMYAGAALEVIGILVAIVRLSAVTSAIAAADGYTTGRAHAIAEHQLAISGTGALIGACLWVWMARVNAAGHHWARTTATALFALDTLGLLLLASQGLSEGTIAAMLNWIVGLAACVCLWRREASQYFNGYRGSTDGVLRSRYF
jgi:hypothetical protein